MHGTRDNDMKPIGPMFAAALAALCPNVEADAARVAQDAAKASRGVVEARNERMHLSVDDRLRDLLRHPAFAGHARLLLPWDDRGYDEALPLRQIGSLLGITRERVRQIKEKALSRLRHVSRARALESFLG